MTKKSSDSIVPLPCLCGCNRISVRPRSTYRWVVAECDECGASCGDVRRSHMRRDDDVAFEAWNNLHNDVYMRLQEAIIRIDELTRELNEYKMKENDHK